MTIQIRQEQMHTLAQSRYKDFEDRMTHHLKKFFPDKMSAMSVAETQAFIRQCVDKAKTYKLTSEQSVVYFSHLTLLLGGNFETDRRYRFASAILQASAGAPDERVKIAMLLAYQLKAKGMIA